MSTITSLSNVNLMTITSLSNVKFDVFNEEDKNIYKIFILFKSNSNDSSFLWGWQWFFCNRCTFFKSWEEKQLQFKNPSKQTMQKIMSHWLQKKQLVATKDKIELLLSSLMAFQKSPICLFNCCPNELSSSFSLQCWITFILISSYKLAAASSHQYNNTNNNTPWQVKISIIFIFKSNSFLLTNKLWK